MASPPTSSDVARLRAGGTVLVPYDPLWPRHFQEIRDQILSVAADLLVEVEHIGSTALPGLAAKPFLDLMPCLRSYDDGLALAERLGVLGYEYKGEYGIPGRHYFSKWIDTGAPACKHNVHAYEVGHAEWTRHLVFRDALRADSALRAEYEAFKENLAAVHHDDVQAYASAKSGFVDAVISRFGGPPRPAQF